MSLAEVLELAMQNQVNLVDFKFVDLLGQWQHTTLPIHNLKEQPFAGLFKMAFYCIGGLRD